jgi:hypothetical protein
MAWKRSVLVVANVTAASDELLDALKTRAAQGPATFTLIVPATPIGGGRAAALQKLDQAVGQLREAGLEIEGGVGAADPIVAVTDVWDPKTYDEIIVSTLPLNVSKWLHAGLPERISKLTDASVTHIVSQPVQPAVAPVAARRQTERGTLGPLSVLAWGGQKER